MLARSFRGSYRAVLPVYVAHWSVRNQSTKSGNNSHTKCNNPEKVINNALFKEKNTPEEEENINKYYERIQEEWNNRYYRQMHNKRRRITIDEILDVLLAITKPITWITLMYMISTNDSRRT